MKKDDLKIGYLVETKDRERWLVMNKNHGTILVKEDGEWEPLNRLNKQLDEKYSRCDRKNDMYIIRVWGFSRLGRMVLKLNPSDRNLLWKRKKVKIAALDTHKYLRNSKTKFKKPKTLEIIDGRVK